MLVKEKVITIEIGKLHIIISNMRPVLEIGHDSHEKVLYKFKTVVVLEKDRAPFNFDPH